jgi:hypothetical protein
MQKACFVDFSGFGSFGMRLAMHIAHVLISTVSFQDRKKEQEDEEIDCCGQCLVGPECCRFK